ncbi:MAG: hypothetical protein CMJ77_14235 [Planctomycetaceae bacterium]|nr:hypothetical protein [Planctomycetaceae bacterium]
MNLNKQLAIAIAIFVSTLVCHVASADSFDLSLTADGTSRWYDHFSDAFGQIDQGFRGDEDRDGFFLISQLPTYVPIGRGADLFPSEGEFTNVGAIEFDAASGAVSSLLLDFDDFVAYNYSILNSRLGDGYSTSVSNVVGNVVASGDGVSAIDLSADITFTYGSTVPDIVEYKGTFAIANDEFQLSVDDDPSIPGFGAFRYAWDVFGQVDNLVDATLPGDFDNDGMLTVADVDLLSDAVLANTTDSKFDVNTDGAVNSSDRTFWIEELKTTYFGDANLDGEFNSSDFISVLIVGEYEDGIPANSGWADGDWNGDKDFSSSDFILALTGGGYEMGPRAAAAVVPEPGTVLGMIMGGLVVFLAGRRTQRI